MGRPKALLEIGGASFLERILRGLHEGGVGEVIVVVGEHVDDIRTHLQRIELPPGLAVSMVVNPEPGRGQLSSLLIALDVIDPNGPRPSGAEPVAWSRGGAAQDEDERQGPVHGIVLALIDHPLVRVTTVRALLNAFAQTRAPVVRPVYEGAHGHPVVFARDVFDALRAAPLDQGARAVVRAMSSRVWDVATDDAGVCEDIDTPEVYERAVAAEEGRGRR
jgi:CTP:molybdopterin cytidylyltransferase MocA